MRRIHFILILGVFWTATGFASNLSSEKVVELRQSSMKTMVSHVRSLGSMAKGKSEFNLDEVKISFDGIAAQADQAIHLFREEKTTPFAEAKAEIWQNYEDFSDKANMLKQVAMKFSDSVDSVEELRDSMMTIGQGCKACHSKYRE